MAKDFILEQLKQTFRGRNSFTREELYDFYRQFDPLLKETTFRWRIYELKTKKLITPISKREFILSYKPVFRPTVGDFEKRIASKIQTQFPNTKFCIWSTRIINEFMLHQPNKFITILQAEKEALDSIFYFLIDNNIKEVYIQPEEEQIERYVSEASNGIVLLPLISKAPLQKARNTNTITLEKLLVDLYSDRKLFIAFQGNELAHIINNAYAHYALDFTKLFNYAKRRRKEIDLMEFLSHNTDIPQHIFSND